MSGTAATSHHAGSNAALTQHDLDVLRASLAELNIGGFSAWGGDEAGVSCRRNRFGGR